MAKYENHIVFALENWYTFTIWIYLEVIFQYIPFIGHNGCYNYLLCSMLLYLSDLDDGEQFLLSNLTEAVEAFTKDLISVDWTRFTHRRLMRS